VQPQLESQNQYNQQQGYGGQPGGYYQPNPQMGYAPQGGYYGMYSNCCENSIVGDSQIGQAGLN
jgi:hypothetical protein